MGELNSFSASSAAESLPRLFLDWASENVTEKHVVFDEDTCTRVEVDCTFVMAIMQKLFLGKLDVLADQTYRGSKLSKLFGQREMEPCVHADEKLGESCAADDLAAYGSLACKDSTNTA